MNSSLKPISLSSPKAQQRQPILRFDLQGQLQGLSGLNAEDLRQISWVSVPTPLVLMLATLVPGNSKSQWQQALPYAFEEHLAQSIDQVFFKVLSRDNRGFTQVAAVAKTQMQSWIDTLQATGLGHVQLIADCFLLPAPPQGAESEKMRVWFAQAHFDKPDELTIRNGLYSGFSGHASWLETLKKSAEIKGDVIRVEHKTAAQIMPEFSRADLKNFGLRDGPYLPKSSKQTKANPWLLPSAVAAMLLVTLLGSKVWQTQQLSQQRDILEQQTTTLFQQMFPNIKRIVNLQAQAKSALSQSGGEESLGPIALTQMVEKVLQTQGNITVKNLVWRGQELQLILQAEALASLQAVEQQLKKNAAFKVRLELQTLENTQVSAKLVIHV